MDSDEHFWETSLAKQVGVSAENSPEMGRYRTARRRAVAVGFEFKPLSKLKPVEPIEEVIERVKTLDNDDSKLIDMEAVLGTIEPPKDTIRDAFKLYYDKLSIGETSRKSPYRKTYVWTLTCRIFAYVQQLKESLNLWPPRVIFRLSAYHWRR